MLATRCSNSPVQIICELVSVIRVGTVSYDSPCPFDRRKTAQVCNALFRTEDIHIVLRVIYVGAHGNYGTDGTVFCRRTGKENRQISRPGKVPGTANSIHETTATDMCLIDLTIDIKLNGRIHGNSSDAADHFGIIRNFLGSYDDFFPVLIDVFIEMLQPFR